MRDGRSVTVEVTADGAGLVSHSGSALLAQRADKLGLTRGGSLRLGGGGGRGGRARGAGGAAGGRCGARGGRAAAPGGRGGGRAPPAPLPPPPPAVATAP